MDNIGTGFNITDIGDFDFIFKPSDGFTKLSEQDIENISRNIDSMKERFLKYCENELKQS